MARLARVVLPGHPVHIIQRGNNRQAVLFAIKNIWIRSEKLRETVAVQSTPTNHIHLLVTPEHETSLLIMMQSIGRCHVRHINSTYQRSGSLWEGRYKSSLIESDNYLLTCSRYIGLNPVRTGMVIKPGDYAWSSYRALFSAHLDNDILKQIRESTQKCTVMGNQRFQEEIEKMLKRRVRKYKHGGDRRSQYFRRVSSDLAP